MKPGTYPASTPAAITCERCSHYWRPRKFAPTKCPKCGSPDYDKPARPRSNGATVSEKPHQITMLAPPLKPTDPPTSDDRCTPPDVIGALLAFWPYGIDLDPCSNPWSQIPATNQLDKAHDSLAEPTWRSLLLAGDVESMIRTIYCNPPYSDPRAFVRRCRLAAEQGAEVVALVRHDCTTEWWADIRGHAAAHCQPSQRLRFRLAGEDTGPSDHASTIVLWLPPLLASSARLMRLVAFRRAFEPIGEVLFPALIGMALIGGAT